MCSAVHCDLKLVALRLGEALHNGLPQLDLGSYMTVCGYRLSQAQCVQCSGSEL